MGWASLSVAPPPPGWGSAGVWADCPPAHWPSSPVGGCPRPVHPEEGPDEGPTPGGACDHGDGHLRTTAPLALAATLGSIHWLLTCGKTGWEPAAPPPQPTSPGPPLTVRLGLCAPPGLGGSPPPGGIRRAELLLLSGLFSHRVGASLWAAAGEGTGSAGQSGGLGSGRCSVRVRRGGAGRHSRAPARSHLLCLPGRASPRTCLNTRRVSPAGRSQHILMVECNSGAVEK